MNFIFFILFYLIKVISNHTFLIDNNDNINRKLEDSKTENKNNLINYLLNLKKNGLVK